MNDLIFNYYFLRKFAHELQQEVGSAVLESAFSSSPNELDLIFMKDLTRFKFKLYLGQKHKFFRFKEFNVNPPKNARPKFQQLIGNKLNKVFAHMHNRSMQFDFSGNRSLVFKLYGNFSNVLYFEKEVVRELLNPQVEKDKILQLPDFKRHVEDISIEEAKIKLEQGTSFINFLKQYNPSAAPFVMEQIPENLTSEEKLSKLNQLLRYLENPSFYVCISPVPKFPSIGVYLGFFEVEGCTAYSSAIEAANAYATYFFRNWPLAEVRHLLLQHINEKRKSLEKRKKSLETHLQKLEKHDNYRLFADLLMANLHLLSGKQAEVSLPHFETGELVLIPLKKDANAQENAARFYRKAKNRFKEEEHTLEQLMDAEIKIEEFRELHAEVEVLEDVKQLRKLLAGLMGERKTPNARDDIFRHFSFKGYDIYAGRNSENNDKLSLHFARKDDVWLHARDVSGSHVVIRSKGKQNPVPSDVIDMAARIAVYYSKARGSSYYPVIFTQRKNIRKPKRAGAGKVLVEKPGLLMAASLTQDELNFLYKENANDK